MDGFSSVGAPASVVCSLSFFCGTQEWFHLGGGFGCPVCTGDRSIQPALGQVVVGRPHDLAPDAHLDHSFGRMVWALDAAGAIGPHTMDGCCKFSLPSVGLSTDHGFGLVSLGVSSWFVASCAVVPS